MRFPPKSYNKELESAEDRREREAQVGALTLFSSFLLLPCSPLFNSFSSQFPLLLLLPHLPPQDLELAKEMAEEDDDAY